MKRILLSQNKLRKNKELSYYAIVDDDDYIILNEWNWSVKICGGNIYASRTDCTGEKKRRILMHRYIINAVDHQTEIDHKDGNGLNNSRSNLRFAKRGDNKANSRSAKNSTSKYLGVSLSVLKNKQTGKKYFYWLAQIEKNRKNYNLGRFKNEEDAALAYNVAAEKLHGEFARLNKIEKSA